MSLYFEAADLLANTSGDGGSLKSRVYSKKGLKSTPAHLYALVVESSKWSNILKEVIEKSGVLKLEKKLTPVLALLLTHDLLLSKKGVACPANHALRLAVERHKARLSAEFTKVRLKRGFPTLDAFRSYIEAGGHEDLAPDGDDKPKLTHPRWIRINTVKTTLQHQLDVTFAGYVHCTSIKAVLRSSMIDLLVYVDKHVPDLIAVHPGANLSKKAAYLNGEIIFQDKASCFPAYLLNAQEDEGDVIDACAAPGNKTTHLAALSHREEGQQGRVFAFERNKSRAEVLKRMVKIAVADETVTVFGGHDFLQADPERDEFNNVTSLLLDPSCSGSGIVGRDDDIKIALPSTDQAEPTSNGRNKSKKRKRNHDSSSTLPEPGAPVQPASTMSENDEQVTSSGKELEDRLKSLASFQLRIVEHAMSFPSARRITYSTCSIHAEENELVTLSALALPAAKERGWRVLRRDEQVEGMKTWNLRGDVNSCRGEGLDDQEVKMVAEACIRCEKGTEEGTMGFFVVGFVRDENNVDRKAATASNEGPSGKSDISNVVEEGDEEEWEGFSDEETG